MKGKFISFCPNLPAWHLVPGLSFSPNSGTQGFWRLGEDIQEPSGSSLAPVARQLLSAGCGLGEGQVVLVHAKRSLAPLSTGNPYILAISFRSSSGPPLAQMPPRCLPNVSQMPPRCLPDASQMPPRCLSDVSEMLPIVFQMPFKCLSDVFQMHQTPYTPIQESVWGLALGSYSSLGNSR